MCFLARFTSIPSSSTRILRREATRRSRVIPNVAKNNASLPFPTEQVKNRSGHQRAEVWRSARRGLAIPLDARADSQQALVVEGFVEVPEQCALKTLI